MDTMPVVARQQLNSPLLIAGTVLGGIAFVQVVALAVYFASGAKAAVQQQPVVATGVQTLPAKRTATAVPDRPMLASRATITAQPMIPELDQPQVKPTPVPPTRLKEANKPLVDELMALAKDNRDRGDMMAALTKLKEAQRIQPDEPEVVAELALTYEKLGWTDKAIDHWARVKEFGERASGALYELADQKLKRGVGPYIPRAELINPPRTQQRGLFGLEDALPEVAPEDATTARLVELADVNTFDEPTGDDALKRLRLRATVQARPGTIDQQKVRIDVLFFDQIDGKHITQTSAQLFPQWITQPADWAGEGVEVLEVDYKLAKPAEGEKSEDRKYYGYQVRLYYDNELQGVKAAPMSLLNDNPAPPQITPETPSE